jgi:hypothetical protein
MTHKKICAENSARYHGLKQSSGSDDLATDNAQADLFPSVGDLGFARILLADLHDDLAGKVSRFRQLNGLSLTLGRRGSMLPGGETAFAARTEARTSFVHGNYIATVMLCQGLAEHMLAARLTPGLSERGLPKRIQFNETLELCVLPID